MMVKKWVIIAESEIDATKLDFIRALEIWISKPHVINRRLCGIKTFFSEDSFQNDNIEDLIKSVQTILPNTTFDSVSQRISENLVQISEVINPLQSTIQARKLMSRHSKHTNGAELVMLDNVSACAAFVPVYESDDYALSPKFPYLLQLNEENQQNKIVLKVLISSTEEVEHLPAIIWLRVSVLPKLKKWSESQPDAPIVPSLSAVSVDKYNELYLHLKEKYGLELVKKWQEKTDPQKYVFEDIAIATYLLLLWEQEREDLDLPQKQTFIDLGCGNGLLVHILVNEGHFGFGLDVRKRNIWDTFSSNVVLKESPIILSPLTTYPDCDWLIGNHSDELTPWIPVFAARSSYNTRFFLLPCCCYDFSCKFQRPSSVLSQYRSYLNYIHEVSRICGFEIVEDKLRIPSTKRICLIGAKRNYAESNERKIDEKRLAFIREHCSSASKVDRASNTCDFPTPALNISNGKQCSHAHRHTELNEDHSTKISWNFHVQVRPDKEVVRNCTQLDRTLVSKIVSLVAKALLNSCDEFVSVPLEDGKMKNWNPGGMLMLSEAVDIVGKDNLSQLKKECGGLQTLLKNHSYIFKVFQGTVSFRNYYSDHMNNVAGKSKTIRIKTKPCWFYKNHPNGCPVFSEQCRFVHEK